MGQTLELLTVEDVEAAMGRVLSGLDFGTAGAGGGTATKRVRPIWAQYHIIKLHFTGISEDRLRKYVAAGIVRKRSGDTQQSPSEYCVDDLDRAYMAESDGKTPKRVRK